MSLRAHALALATLVSVIAVSSALAGRSDATFTVTSSLDGKTVLPLRNHWAANANGPQSIDPVRHPGRDLQRHLNAPPLTRKEEER